MKVRKLFLLCVFGLFISWSLEANVDTWRELPKGVMPAEDTELAQSEVSTQAWTRVSDFTLTDATMASDVGLQSSVFAQDYEPADEGRGADPQGGIVARFEDRMQTPNVLRGVSLSNEWEDVAYKVESGGQLRLPFINGAREAGIVQHLGPLGLDIYSVTAQGLYSELHYPHNAFRSDERDFLDIVGLQGAVTLDFGDSFHLGAVFNVYYLPTVNNVGFYSLTGTDDFLSSRAGFLFQEDLGEWHFSASDGFQVGYGLGDLYAGYEVDEIATAGRYRFGRPESSGAREGYFVGEDVYFVNTISTSASRQLSDSWRFRTSILHSDYWTESNIGDFSDMFLAAAGVYYDPVGSPYSAYGAYNYYQMAKEKFVGQTVMVGATRSLTPTFKMHGRVGWMNIIKGNGSLGRDRFLWEVGIVHLVNERLSHSLFGGYNYVVTDYGDTFVGNYGRYTVNYRVPGSDWRVVGAIQAYNNDLTGLNSLMYGGQIIWALAEKTNLSFIGGSYRSARHGIFEFKRNILGLSLSHYFTSSLSCNLGWYISEQRHANRSLDFNERLLRFGITQSF